MSEGPETRAERDGIGSLTVPREALWGIHRSRAKANFDLAGREVHPELLRAFGEVKRAAMGTLTRLGVWEGRLGQALDQACAEVAEGHHGPDLATDALQGGAGTSVNMVVNEVIANRVCVLLGGRPGDRNLCDPHDVVNRCQSTNDTFPTALRVAAIRGFRRLAQATVELQEVCQDREKAFSKVVCLGRTEFQDASLMTMGRRFGAWADALGRDRWRFSKCEERLRVVNLGGTAIGTATGALRSYVFKVTEDLRRLTGLPLARSENLVDGTANADVFAEVAGLLGALAVTLMKISDDLRFLSSGPQGGIGELVLPALQEGSSLMPGKVNPVIPEAVIQACLQVLGDQGVILQACARGSLEINPFLPLVADRLLNGIDLMERSCRSLGNRVLKSLKLDETRISRHRDAVIPEATALATLLGHETAGNLAREALDQGKRLSVLVVERGLLSSEEVTRALSAEAVLRLGEPDGPGTGGPGRNGESPSSHPPTLEKP